MATHGFNKLLPLLFNMNVSIGHHIFTSTNSFCVGMLYEFDTYNPGLGFLNSPEKNGPVRAIADHDCDVS